MNGNWIRRPHICLLFIPSFSKWKLARRKARKQTVGKLRPHIFGYYSSEEEKLEERGIETGKFRLRVREREECQADNSPQLFFLFSFDYKLHKIFLEWHFRNLACSYDKKDSFLRSSLRKTKKERKQMDFPTPPRISSLSIVARILKEHQGWGGRDETLLSGPCVCRERMKLHSSEKAFFIIRLSMRREGSRADAGGIFRGGWVTWH